MDSANESSCYIAAALAIGGGLWFVMNLDPVWWLAWILPGLLFALALRTEGWTSRGPGGAGRADRRGEQSRLSSSR